MIAHTITADGTMTIVVNGHTLAIAKDHPSYPQLVDAIKKGAEEEVLKLADIPYAVNEYTSGRVTIKAGVVTLDGRPVHGHIVSRILSLMQAGFPFEHMCLFLQNLYDNPSKRAIEELYSFMETQGIPITTRGTLLAYKRVTSDWKDVWSRTWDYRIGQKPKMARNLVDDNWGLACSEGFHIGSRYYAETYCPNAGPIVIVEVNPRDVVTVPPSEINKMRCCEFELIAEDRGVMTKSPVYAGTTGQPLSPAEAATYHVPMDKVPDDDEIDDDIACDDDVDDQHRKALLVRRCPRCDADLTVANAIDVELSIGSMHVVITSRVMPSRDDEEFEVADTGDSAIANGYHSETRCGRCKLGLTPWEIGWIGRERDYGADTLENVDDDAYDFAPLPVTNAEPAAEMAVSPDAVPKTSKFGNFFKRILNR